MDEIFYCMYSNNKMQMIQCIYKSSRIIVCFLKKGVCQHEKIESKSYLQFVILILLLFIIGGMLGLLLNRFRLCHHKAISGYYWCPDGVCN